MEVSMKVGVEEYMSEMLNREGVRIVNELSKKYGFNMEEGIEYVNLCKMEVKVSKVKNKGVSGATVSPTTSKIVLPFVGSKNENNCAGIRLNHGLYTQCQNEFDITHTSGEKSFNVCKTCFKQIEKNSNGKPTYGYIDDRIEFGEKFRDPKGKAPVRYGNIMEKLNISRETAEKEAERLGFKIPEEQFEVKKAQRGRPKKEVVAIDTSESDTEQPKPTRGRPKKNAKPMSTNMGDDIIKGLLSGGHPNKETNKGDTVAALTPTKETNKGKSAATVSPPKELEVELPSDESSDEEELAVTEFKIEGVKYLKAADNTLYDFKTHEEVGEWDPSKGIIN